MEESSPPSSSLEAALETFWERALAAEAAPPDELTAEFIGPHLERLRKMTQQAELLARIAAANPPERCSKLWSLSGVEGVVPVPSVRVNRASAALGAKVLRALYSVWDVPSVGRVAMVCDVLGGTRALIHWMSDQLEDLIRQKLRREEPAGTIKGIWSLLERRMLAEGATPLAGRAEVALLFMPKGTNRCIAAVQGASHARIFRKNGQGEVVQIPLGPGSLGCFSLNPDHPCPVTLFEAPLMSGDRVVLASGGLWSCCEGKLLPYLKGHWDQKDLAGSICKRAVGHWQPRQHLSIVTYNVE